jgi:hypothetical protein
MKFPCPSGSYKLSYDYPIRHAIDFSGISDLKKINLPEKLTKFRDFLYNPKKRRISFLVANNSSCVTNDQWFKNGDIYKRGVWFSQDPQVHEFNRIFLVSNPQIKFTNNDPNGIQTYDFLDKENDQTGAIKFFKDLLKIFTGIPEKLDTGINAILIGVVGIVLFKFFEIVKVKKNDQ